MLDFDKVRPGFRQLFLDVVAAVVVAKLNKSD